MLVSKKFHSIQRLFPREALQNLSLPFNAIRSERLYSQVAHQIVQAIQEGKFPVEQRLPSERDLALRFNVSRQTIREAMIVLEGAGLVEVRMGSGVYVIPHPTPSKKQAVKIDKGPSPVDVMEARILMESETAQRAALLVNETQIEELEAIQGQFEQVCGQNDPSDQVDRMFHLTIAKIAGNEALLYLLDTLWGISVIRRKMNTHIAEQNYRKAAAQEHRHIINMLKLHAPCASAEAMRSHITQSMKRLQDAFDLSAS